MIGPTTKTKLIGIPEELREVMNQRCEFPSGCWNTLEYCLVINVTHYFYGFKDNRGVFLCEIHKNPRISVQDNKWERELKVKMQWLLDESQKKIIKRWPKSQKQGTHKIGETIKL